MKNNRTSRYHFFSDVYSLYVRGYMCITLSSDYWMKCFCSCFLGHMRSHLLISSNYQYAHHHIHLTAIFSLCHKDPKKIIKFLVIPSSNFKNNTSLRWSSTISMHSNMVKQQWYFTEVNMNDINKLFNYVCQMNGAEYITFQTSNL